jgi:hypothetical protein
MKCYMCALEGREQEAVAICKFCNVALCHDHLVQEHEENPTAAKFSCTHPRPSRIAVRETSPRKEFETCNQGN